MQLPETDITAELVFNDRQMAEDFAIRYTRKTMMGHSISATINNKVTVKIWNVTDDIKQWINSCFNLPPTKD